MEKDSNVLKFIDFLSKRIEEKFLGKSIKDSKILYEIKLFVYNLVDEYFKQNNIYKNFSVEVSQLGSAIFFDFFNDKHEQEELYDLLKN